VSTEKDPVEQQIDAETPDETTEKVEAVEADAREDSPEDTDAPSEADVLKDQLLRAQAEMQNVRRRAEQDVEKARKFALDRFAGDLLDVADNLERALKSSEPGDETTGALLEGVELTLKSLLDVFSKHGLTQIDPLGEPFDPQLHEAMAQVPNPDMEPNSVMEVMEKGYTLNGRLVRPARVIVVKSG
jgi:molecular chaperone GrpE